MDQQIKDWMDNQLAEFQENIKLMSPDEKDQLLLHLHNGVLNIAAHYNERRSDVEDIAHDIIEGKDISKFKPEHRFVYFNYKGSRLEYDTLTTLIAYETDGDDWQTLMCEYTDGVDRAEIRKLHKCEKCGCMQFKLQEAMETVELTHKIYIRGDYHYDIVSTNIDKCMESCEVHPPISVTCEKCGADASYIFAADPPGDGEPDEHKD